MVEKLASSEIAQSREQFEKRGNEKSWNLTRRPDGSYDNAFTAYRWDDWQISWQAAERDTRERVAQFIENAMIPESFRKTKIYTEAEQEVDKYFKMLVDSIRGKE